MNLPPTFDAKAAWHSLPPGEQERLGIAALILGCAAHGSDDGDGYHATPLSTASETASAETHDILVEAYQAASRLFRMTPDLNQVGVRACASCGCTDSHGCFPACFWVGPTTCSSCVALQDNNAGQPGNKEDHQ